MVAGALRRAMHKAVLAAREVIALTPRTMGAITVNSWRMSRRAARWRAARPDEAWSDAGAFTGAATTGRSGIACTFERATLHVHALADDLVRLAWGPGPAPFDVATRDAVCRPPTEVRLEVGPGGAALSTPFVRVEVDDAGVSVLDRSGAWRYRELTPRFGGPRRMLRRVLRDGERLCGLGEQAAGLDLTGGRFRLWNRDPGGSWGPGQNPLYCGIPVTVGLHERGPVWAFHENSFESEFVVGRTDHADHGVSATFEDGAVVTYVALGELDEALTTAATLLGFPAMPPRWALGYHHCRWGWRTRDAVDDVVEGFASREIPLSAVHLDIDHMDHFRVFTTDPHRYRDLDGLATSAAKHGTRVVTIVDPAVRRDEGFDLYREGRDGGHFVRDADGAPQLGTVWPGWSAFPDFTSPATRAWWSEQYASLLDHGVAGAWHDMNEPTSITLWGDRTLPRDAVHDFEGRLGTHAEAHNLYGLLMDRAGHDALSREGRRAFVLSRSGWAGLQRWAWHWTADVESDPAALAQQVATFLGLSLSSVPFTGSDLGGFSGVPTAELYVRWLELGVVSPFCRTHCVLGSPDREPWRFAAPFDVAIARLIRLRYRLLPHLYRLAADAHRLGHPLVRPLDWPSGGSRSGWSADTSAFLLGDELCVVPVADPDADRVAAVLPAGRWRRRRLCEPVRGERGTDHDVDGGPVVLDAPLGQPVVLQRAGSVVVLDDGADRGPLEVSHAARTWSLHVVPDAAGAATGRGYDDAGDGDGPSRHDEYVAQTSGGVIEVRWHPQGEHARRGPVEVHVAGAVAGPARCDGRPVAARAEEGGAVLELEGPFGVVELPVA